MDGEYSSSNGNAPCRTSKPTVTIDAIKDLLHRRYGIRTSEIKEYDSYEDRIYYVKTEPGFEVGKKTEFIAKVLNSEATAAKGVVALQSEVLEYLKSFPDLGCSRIVPNLDGNLLSYEVISCDFHEGGVYIGKESALCTLRLFEFLPGKTLSEVPPRPPSFFFEVGRHLGNVQKALQEYVKDVTPLKVKAETFKWSISLLPYVRDYLPVIKGTKRRQMCEDVIKLFEATVVPAMGDLRKGLVYHDCSGYNLIVDVSSVIDHARVLPVTLNGDSSWAIRGLIDFDHVMYTCLVYEISIGMMYLMFCSDQPLEAAAYLLAGFETMAPLPTSERRLLKVLVAGRFIQSLVFGSLQSQIHPDNAYVGTTQVKGWTLFEKWWNQSESQLETMWDCIKSECLLN